jgi:hypothetical protein
MRRQRSALVLRDAAERPRENAVAIFRERHDSAAVSAELQCSSGSLRKE